MPQEKLSPAARRGLTWVTLGATLLGSSAIFVKWAMLGGVGPATVGFYRMLFALPGILWLVRREGGLGLSRSALWAMLAGVAFSGDLTLWHSAMNHTSAANATFIVCGLSPLWVALFSVGFYATRYRSIGWFGQGLSVLGSFILAFARGARVGTGIGELLAIASSLCYAAFSLCLARAREKSSARQALLWMSVGSFLSFVVIECVERAPLYGFSTKAWISLVGLAALVQLLAWLLINSGIDKVPIALAALALGCQQVATPFLSAWLLDEPLRPLGLFGGGLIFVGIYCVAGGARSRVSPGSGSTL